MTTVLIADDHPIVLEGLAALLESAGYSIVARCANGLDVLDEFQHHRPDLLVLDVNMPGLSGIEIVRNLKEKGQQAIMVLLTASIATAEIINAMELGVDGIVLKDSAPRDLLHCLASVRGGYRWIDPQVIGRTAEAAEGTMAAFGSLTPREMQVARLAARGLRNKEIGQQLRITEGTVKMHLHSVYEKLAVGSRVELTNAVREAGLV